MKRLNIAYVPKYNSRAFTNISKRFKPKSHNYNLGENSLPHISEKIMIEEEFELILGESDDVGQLKNIIFSK